MLFSPIKIQDLKLKNRLFALPVFTGYGLPDSRVSPLMLEHYSRLSGSGAAVVVIPNVAVAENGRTSERSLLLDHDEYIEGLRRLVKVIKENDALACVQLNHGGRYAVTDHPLLPSAMDAAEIASNILILKSFMKRFPFVKRFGLTAHVAKMTAGWMHEMTDSEIENVITLFAEAAYRAYQAGADMIELHGATGYLISQFLSATKNRRAAPWGGSADARARFPLKIIDEIKNKLPENIPVGFRLILDEKTKGGISTNDAMKFAEKLEHQGIAYLSATVGTYQSMFAPDVAKQLAKPGYLADLAKALRQRVNIPVIISGRIVSPILAEKILRKKEADIIGLGRPLLVDADWIRKAREKRKIVGCRNCNTCFQSVGLGVGVVCDRWPKVVQDRIKLEIRFTSRHAYRTLVVLSSMADLETVRNQVRQRVPIHEDIFDRLLFLDTGEEAGFEEAAKECMAWCDRYLRNRLKRGRIEYVFRNDVENPVDVVLEHLKENFGDISFMHDEKSQWKNHLILKVPADVVVHRGGTHPNLTKVLVPCDLSTFTLMQIRIALHGFQGRSNIDYHFVHVTRSPHAATDTWIGILDKLALDKSTKLKLLEQKKGLSVAEILLDEAKKGDYGSLILGRRGGLALVRRRILGSVSERLLKELPECDFHIIG